MDAKLFCTISVPTSEDEVEKNSRPKRDRVGEKLERFWGVLHVSELKNTGSVPHKVSGSIAGLSTRDLPLLTPSEGVV